MRRYFELSRTQTYSLLFAIPLLLLYEAGAAWVSTTSEAPLRNGADVLIRALLATGGLHSTVAFTAFLVAVAGVVVLVEWRRKRVKGLQAGVFAGMMAESALYALLFGMVVGTATQAILEGAGLRLAADRGGTMASLPLAEGIVLSLGAGIYEELVFRVLMVGGLLYVFGSAGVGKTKSRVFAAILAAFLFSAFHYVGPYAYPLEVSSFTFRFLAGLAFNALFIARGFGIAAWTHALYDVFLLIAMRPG